MQLSPVELKKTDTPWAKKKDYFLSIDLKNTY